MTTRDEAIKAVSGAFATKQNSIEWQMAMTGDGHGLVDAGNGTLYVRLTSNSSVIQVLNGGISLSDGVLCRIIKPAEDPLNWYAVRATDQRIDENGASGGSPTYNTPPHHRSHEYLGVDQVNLDWRQITTLRVYAYSGFVVGVLAGLLPRPGADLVVPTQTLDLSSSVPASGARFTLISVNSAGALVATDGTVATGILTLTLGDIPDTPAGNFRLAAVRLYAGQTAISESTASNDIRDLRWPQERLATSISPADIALADTHVIVGNASGAGADVAMSGDATIANTGALTLATVNANVGSFTYASLTVNAKGLVTAASSGTTPPTGTGTAGRVTQWATTTTLGDSNLIGSGAGLLTLSASGTYTLTVPATGTAALLQVANTFTLGPNTFQAGADANIPIIAKGNSATQSAALQEWQTSAAGVSQRFNNNGTINIVSSIRVGDLLAPASQHLLAFESTRTDTANPSGGLNGVRAIHSLAPTANSAASISEYYGLTTVQPSSSTTMSGTVYGLDYTMLLRGTSITYSNVDRIGVRAIVDGFAPSSTVPKLYGAQFAVLTDSATCTITDARRLHLLRGTFVGAATTFYGLYIDAVDQGATNYAIYSAGGQSYHSGNIGIGNGTTAFAASTPIHAILNNATTNAVDNLLTLAHNSTGTPTAPFGGAIALNLESASTADQVGGRIEWLWNVATHASAVSDVVLSAAYNSGAAIVAKEFLRGRGNAGIIVTGSQTGTYTATADNLTLSAIHHFVVVTAASKTVTLPAAAGCTGREYIIKTTATSTTIDGNGAELIDGSATLVIYQYEAAQIISDGTGWHIV